MGKRYKFKLKEGDTKPTVEDNAVINDERFIIGVKTVENLRRFYLKNSVLPVLSIPLKWNDVSKSFDVGYAPSVQLLDKSGVTVNPATEDTLSAIKTNSDKLQNLDVALSLLATLIRLGRNITLAWIYGGEATAPAAGTSLVSKTVSTGKAGYVYGIFISAGEANDFKINWTSKGTAYSIRIAFSSKGVLIVSDDKAINEGLAADGGSTISITNVNAGSSGIVYQAGILYGEV